MLASAFNIRPVKAQAIHWGSSVVRESEYFNFGMGDIYWSIANEERGYFYGSPSTPTVFFADKIENYWGSYDSYQGVQHIWEFTDASNHEWFTQHSITFAEETSPYYTGILLIHQGDLYGAIKPKSIHNGDLNHPQDYVLEYDWWYDDSGGSDFSSLKPPPSKLEAMIDVDPDTLNLKSKSECILAYIELPEGHNVSDIDVSTILLNDTISAELKPIGIGDEDDDGVPDLMVKFNRAEVMELLGTVDYGEDTGKSVEVTLTITGEVAEAPFEGSEIVKVLFKG